METALLGLILLLNVGGAAQEHNLTFDPQWQVGDRFDVEYRLPTVLRLKQPGGTIAGRELVQIVRYQVTGKGLMDGKTLVKIVATAGYGKSEFTYTFDSNALVLVAIEEALANAQPIKTQNPFDAEAIMFDKRLFSSIIADFPKLPLQNLNEQRLVTAPAGRYLAFTQNVTFAGAGSCTVQMTRPDREFGLTQRSVQRWETGKKWWSEASISLGDRTLISGRLLEPALRADVSVINADSPEPVMIGDKLTYTLAVRNDGPDLATGVTLSDPLPTGVRFISASPACVEAGRVITCALGDLPLGGSATVAIVVSLQSSGPITNIASVSAMESDPNPANNQGTAISNVRADSDGDGMPDDWELANRLNPGDPSDAAADPDGDTLTNLQEFRAGTDPRDAASVLRITAIEQTGMTITIRFTTAPGKIYRLERSDDLSSRDWSVVVMNIDGTGAIEQITVPDGASQSKRFYRLRLLP
jgi:uncharacterized repeat protein (TIGR01451 family)